MEHAEFKTGLAAASELALNGIEDFEGSKQSKGSRLRAPFNKSQRGVVEASGDLEVKSDLNFNSPIHRGAAAAESTAAPAAAETAGKR